MSLPNINLQVNISGSNAASGSSPGGGSENFNITQLLQLLSGTGSGQADTVYDASLSLAASASNSLDLIGALTDKFGATVNLLHVKAIFIRAGAANPGDLTLGNGATPAALGFGAGTHTWALSPGECFFATKGQGASAGWACVGGASDIFKIAAAATAGTYTFDIIVVGTST